MLKKLLTLLGVLLVTASTAGAQTIFRMNYGVDSGGWPGTVGSRVTHDQVRVPGGGPQGQDAFDMLQRYAPNADRYGAEFDWGWNGDLEAQDPPSGSRRYYRWRMRFSPDTNLQGVYSGDGSAVGITNKILIIGDGCGSNCRVILSYRGPTTNGGPRYWRVALDGGVDPGTVTTGIPANGEWFTVQLEVTTGSNGGYKLWLNNDNYNAPNAAVTRLVNPTRHRYVFFGAYNNDGLQSTGVHQYRHANFEVGTTFVPFGTVTPPGPVVVNCAGTWSNWTRQQNSETACVNDTRTFIESRSFTVTQQPQNGGTVCPASPEVRTQTEACGVVPPPVSSSIFSEDFSAGLSRSFTSSGYGSLNQTQYSVVNGSLVHTIPAGGGQQYATQHFADARTGPIVSPSGPVNDLYVSYRVQYAPGFDFGATPKQLIIGTQDVRRHENACCNPWTAHYLTTFVSAQGQLLAEGNNKQAASGQWLNLGPFVPVTLTTGRWYLVEVRRRLNDFGQDNGIFQLWLDGQLIADRSNVRWRTAWDGTFGADASGSNFVMISDYFNGGARSTAQSILYDDVRVSGERGIVPPPPPPPVLTCETAPIVVSGISWPSAGEGARTGRFTWTVANVVTTLAKAEFLWSPQRLVLTDVRGCSATVVRP